MRLSELVNSGHMKKKDLNCAETILYGANEVYGLGLDPDTLERTVYDALTRPGIGLADVLVPTTDALTLAPASIMLAGAEIELSQTPGKELILGRQLKSVSDQYDICIIDCSPSFGLLTIGTLVACTDVIVPVQAQYYSLEGLRRVMETIRLIRRRFRSSSAEHLNILLTLVEDRTTASRQIQLHSYIERGVLTLQDAGIQFYDFLVSGGVSELPGGDPPEVVAVLDHVHRTRFGLGFKFRLGLVAGEQPPAYRFCLLEQRTCEYAFGFSSVRF